MNWPGCFNLEPGTWNLELETLLKAEALRLGFTLSGIAPATEADGFPRFRHWLDRGYAGQMDYLHRLGPPRQHPSSILESALSVLMLGLEYSGVRSQETGDRKPEAGQ